MRRGFLCLVMVMDWASRHVLAWRLSNTLDADFCVKALDDTLACHGRPEIFNTDQGSRFTSVAFTGCVREAGVQISMDARGRCMDNAPVTLARSCRRPCTHDDRYYLPLSAGAVQPAR